MLEHVAVRLDEVAVRADEPGDPRERRPVDLAQPAVGGLLGRDGAALVELEPGVVLGEVVEQDPRLPLERAQPRPPLELVARGSGGS